LPPQAVQQISTTSARNRLAVQEYKHVQRWADTILQRPAVKRGRMVNRVNGDPSSPLHERHNASDFDIRMQDKLNAVS
jgi:GST-like protein